MEERIRILLVEDDEVDRMAVSRAFKTAGIPAEMTVAVDCQSAIDALLGPSPVEHGNGNAEGTDCEFATLKEPNFECVLLDYRLPDGDGLALVQEVRGVGIKVPLVVLTGQGDEQTAVELMKAGASDYLPKSKLSAETLARSVLNAVRIYRAEKDAALAQERLRDSEERYRLVLEGSNDGIWDWDLTTHAIYCNDRLYEITGLSADEVKVNYDLVCELLHPDDRLRISQAVADHLEHNVELEVEFRLLHSCGEYRYCIARGKAWRNAQGRPFRMSGVISDISERKRAEESLRFLAEASVLLSASLDYEKTLESLAQLTVSFLADLCVVDIVENGVVRRMAVAFAEPNWEEQVGKLHDGGDLSRPYYPPDLNSLHPVMNVIRTGVSWLVPEITDLELVESKTDELHLQMLREMDFKSYMIVPLLVRGRTLGAISFLSSQPNRRYRQADLAVAEELARRAALSIENGQLYQETQETSENLRQAILILGEQQQQLRTLQQLTNLLNQRLSDLPGLLREMVEAVAGAIPGAEFCLIMLNNPQCDGLMLTVMAGVGTEKLRLENALSTDIGLFSRVLKTGEAQLIQCLNGNSSKLEGFGAAMYAIAIESVQSGRLGVLAIGNWQDQNAFDPEDLHLLVAVGEQAAIAIDNARMIKALEDQEKRLEAKQKMLAEKNQELENQRQQLQLSNLQLLEAARLKSQFLATMSHELRTPMNAVIGFSQLLLRQRQSPLTPQQVDMIGRILSNGKHLLALINEILDLSKIEAGRLELKQETFNLMTLIRATVDQLRSLADEKNLTLNVRGSLQNANVINDSIRLRQILVNLLSNAIKFTDQGSVEVIVTEISPERLAIAVQDTGIGIAEEELEHIFEEFRQIDQTLTRRYPGTGLGLAITKSLVQLMQGTIQVESILGKGSTFRIELPRTVKSLPQSDDHTTDTHIQQGTGSFNVSQLAPSLPKHQTGRLLY